MGQIVLKKMVRPTFNRIITTANKYKYDETNKGIIDPTKTSSKYMDIQTVVAVGPKVFDIEKGMTVSLSFERYRQRQYKDNGIAQDDPTIQKMSRGDVYNIPSLMIDGVEYFLLGDNDVEFIIPEGGFEETTDTGLIKPSLIV